MKFFKLLPFYIYWHYSKGIFDLIDFSKNILWFVWNFFSIKNLLLNFFTPFERLKENYKGGLDIEQLAESFVVTTLMRIIGIVFRSIVIVMGLIAYLITLALCVMLFFLWLALPLLILILFIIVIYVILRNNK